MYTFHIYIYANYDPMHTDNYPLKKNGNPEFNKSIGMGNERVYTNLRNKHRNLYVSQLISNSMRAFSIRSFSLSLSFAESHAKHNNEWMKYYTLSIWIRWRYEPNWISLKTDLSDLIACLRRVYFLLNKMTIVRKRISHRASRHYGYLVFTEENKIYMFQRVYL